LRLRSSRCDLFHDRHIRFARSLKVAEIPRIYGSFDAPFEGRLIFCVETVTISVTHISLEINIHVPKSITITPSVFHTTN
jgi:hypothetical protein